MHYPCDLSRAVTYCGRRRICENIEPCMNLCIITRYMLVVLTFWIALGEIASDDGSFCNCVNLCPVRASTVACYLWVLESLGGFPQASSEAVELQWCFFLRLTLLATFVASLASLGLAASSIARLVWAPFNGLLAYRFLPSDLRRLGLKSEFFRPFRW